MNNDIAIKVENLSKRYRIGVEEEQHDTLAGAMLSWVKSPLDNFRELRRLTTFDDGRPTTKDQGPTTNDQPSSSVNRTANTAASNPSSPANGDSSPNDIIWALKDISFEVKRGEVVGIIGRNGAGKSTLLKILSKITAPTAGRVVLNGRVSSLLEVGTGFHQELTGRENIYLNGTVLGMTKGEVDRKFDEIVAFSGVEKFIDTPVKRYSSGMKVRLAFSVAAHLEPEILLVDEVLAVGDAAFQEKCLGKMNKVAKEGRTVLYVSHRMESVESLCTRAFLLRSGRVVNTGKPHEVINRYLASVSDKRDQALAHRTDRNGNGSVRLTDIDFQDTAGESIAAPRCGQDIKIALDFRCHQGDASEVEFAINFFSLRGQFLFVCNNKISHGKFRNLPNDGRIICSIPNFPLVPGSYYLNLYCTVRGIVADHIKHAVEIKVAAGDFFGSGKLPPQERGGVLIVHNWQVAEKQAINSKT